MTPIDILLKNNKEWANAQVKADPGFFKRLEALQTPEFLWIGCSDSRVPANQITGTKPGEVFVHRNVANLVVQNDLNAMSVIQYSVQVLKVKHIIVCGHYGCGGIQAAMSNQNWGLLDKWLYHIKTVYVKHKAELDAIPNEEERLKKLVEFNVLEQILTLSKTDIIRNSWKNEQAPELHGWVYSLSNGILKSIIEMVPDSNMQIN